MHFSVLFSIWNALFSSITGGYSENQKSLFSTDVFYVFKWTQNAKNLYYTTLNATQRKPNWLINNLKQKLICLTTIIQLHI